MKPKDLTPLTLPEIQQKELDTVIAGTKEECLCAIHRDGCLLCANGKHDGHCQKPQEFVPHFRTSEASDYLNTDDVKVTAGSTKPDEPQKQPKIEQLPEVKERKRIDQKKFVKRAEELRKAHNNEIEPLDLYKEIENIHDATVLMATNTVLLQRKLNEVIVRLNEL